MISSSYSVFAQESPSSLKAKLENYVHSTDTIFKNQLVSDRAFNLFVQKKTSYYLTGASEISLSKLYATYSSDKDKFNFGLNFTNKDDDKRLEWLFTPMLQSTIKSDFTTFYKKGAWESDIHLGFKVSYFPGGKISFNGMDRDDEQETKLIIRRNLELVKILNSIDSTEISNNERVAILKNNVQKSLDDIYRHTLIAHPNDKKNDKEVKEKTKEYLEKLYSNQKQKLNSRINDQSAKPKSEDEYKSQIAKAEVDALLEKGAYNSFWNYWISVWGFYPIAKSQTYVASNNLQNFETQKIDFWEANVQINGILEINNCLSFYGFAGFKIFNNNTIGAGLLTSVDYYQYYQFPQTNLSNLAVLENNKGYIGDYKEFKTTNFNAQLVISLSNTNELGKERFCTPGVSMFIEKNTGHYSRLNLRFGAPLRFRGKSTPINIEPQIILNDIKNYTKNENHKVEPIIGINVGLPFTALFK
jgi:hypothetical protein